MESTTTPQPPVPTSTSRPCTETILMMDFTRIPSDSTGSNVEVISISDLEEERDLFSRSRSFADYPHHELRRALLAICDSFYAHLQVSHRGSMFTVRASAFRYSDFEFRLSVGSHPIARAVTFEVYCERCASVIFRHIIPCLCDAHRFFRIMPGLGEHVSFYKANHSYPRPRFNRDLFYTAIQTQIHQVFKSQQSPQFVQLPDFAGQPSVVTRTVGC